VIAVRESTGAYWKPVWNILDGQLKLILANAHHVRALPGEKTDNEDGRRLASLMRHGLIRPSLVPSRDIRELRDLTRYGKKLLANGTAERNRIQKVLEDTNINWYLSSRMCSVSPVGVSCTPCSKNRMSNTRLPGSLEPGTQNGESENRLKQSGGRSAPTLHAIHAHTLTGLVPLECPSPRFLFVHTLQSR
jgi:hypothetical protein